MVYTDSKGYGVCLEKSSMLWQMPSGNRRVQAVEKPKYKVLGQAFFKKLAGSRGGAPRRSPQRAKLSQRFQSEENGGLGEETPKGVSSPIHRSFAPLNAKTQMQAHIFNSLIHPLPTKA